MILQRMSVCNKANVCDEVYKCAKGNYRIKVEKLLFYHGGGNCDSIQITFFYYSSRSGDIPKELLKSFYGYLITDSKGARLREYINRLFSLEEKMKEFFCEKKKNKRQVASCAILDAFLACLHEIFNKYVALCFLLYRIPKSEETGQ